MNRKTVAEEIATIGKEPYGGNLVGVEIHPHDEGIIFETPKGIIPAILANASAKHSAIYLRNGNAEIGHVEHLLATFYALGITDARVQVKRCPSRSFKVLDRLGLTTKAEALPIFRNRQKEICDLISVAGLEDLGEDQLIEFDQTYGNDQLTISPSDEFTLTAKTDYPVPGDEVFTFIRGKTDYKTQMSESRPFANVPYWTHSGPLAPVCNQLVKLAFPNYGIGHNLQKDFFKGQPDITKWQEESLMRGEIAVHTVVDRLGAFALLGKRFKGAHISAYRSGHKNDLEVLQSLPEEYKQRN